MLRRQECLTCYHRDLPGATCALGLGDTSPAPGGGCPRHDRTRPIPWSDKEIEFLHQMCGRYNIEQVVRMLNEKFWPKFAFVNLEVRTYASVRGQMRLQHIDHRYVSGDLTVADAAREIGVGYRRLLYHVNKILEEHRKHGGKMEINVYRSGPATFIKQEDIPKLAALFPKIEDAYTLEEAAKRLGYSYSYLKNLVGAGAIPGAVRNKGRWMLPRTQIERMVREMIKSGETTRRWHTPSYVEWRNRRYALRSRRRGSTPMQ